MYEFTNEQGKKRALITKEEAQRVIAATATAQCMTKDEVITSPYFRNISDIFGIDLRSIKQKPGENFMDYAIIYYF